MSLPESPVPSPPVPPSPRLPKAFNPFYAVLVAAGIAFTITACAYGVMTVRDMHGGPPASAGESGASLMDGLRSHGFGILMTELAVLAVATFGAIGTDDYWRRRAMRESANPLELP